MKHNKINKGAGQNLTKKNQTGTQCRTNIAGF